MVLEMLGWPGLVIAMNKRHAGKTRCINHFLINEAWYLVDLPGYGYAKSSKDKRLSWNAFTKQYFLKRETLVSVLLLVDSSIPPQQIDLECATWLSESQVPYMLVFTKADKKKKKGPNVEENVNAFLDMVQAAFRWVPDSFLTSASEGQGRGDILAHLSSLQQAWLLKSRSKEGEARQIDGGE
jgi:GTP-binding protein